MTLRLAAAGTARAAAGARTSLPAGQLPAQPVPHGTRPLGSQRGPLRHVLGVVLRPHRRHRRAAASAAGRSSTPTCCCARTARVVRQRGRRGSGRGALAHHATTTSSHTTTEAERMLGAQAYPFARGAVRKHAADSSLPRRRHTPWLGALLPAPRGDLRDGRPRAGHRRAHPGAPGDRPNLHAMARSTCRLCGECDIGCNYGAKNTLDYNYLSEAVHEGAEIRDQCEVRELEHREGGGYIVRYVEHDLDQEGSAARYVAACRCARSRRPASSCRPARSARPGCCCATNVDWAASGRPWAATSPATATCSHWPSSRAHASGTPIRVEGGVGPSITVAAAFDGVADPGARPGMPGRGFYIEDAGYPDLLSWVVHSASLPSLAGAPGPHHQGARAAAPWPWRRQRT